MKRSLRSIAVTIIVIAIAIITGFLIHQRGKHLGQEVLSDVKHDSHLESEEMTRKVMQTDNEHRFGDSDARAFQEENTVAYGKLKGRVEDSDTNEPVKEFTVLVMSRRTNQLHEFNFQERKDGSFQTGNLPAGDVIIRFTAEGYRPHTFLEDPTTTDDVPMGIGDGGTTDMGTIHMSKEHPKVHVFRGTVLSEETDEPIAAAILWLYYPWDSYWSKEDVTITDSKGNFSLRYHCPGQNKIVIQHKDYAPLENEISLLAEIETQLFYLSHGGTLAVRVKDADGGPVMQIKVGIVESLGGFFREEFSTDENGECLFTNLPEKRHYVSLINPYAANNYPSVGKHVEIFKGKASELEFTLGSGHTLSGQVSYKGNPLSGVKVELRPITWFINGRGSYGEFKTDNNGTYEIYDVEAGEYLLRFREYLYSTRDVLLKHERIEIKDRDVELNVSFPSGSISGTVTDKNGIGRSSARISLIPLSEECEIPDSLKIWGMSPFRLILYTRSVETDSEGRYILDNIGEGKFQIIAGETYYFGTISRIVEKDKDEALEGVDFQLRSASEIMCEIETWDNASPPKAHILVLDDSGYTMMIDDIHYYEGQYKLLGLGMGDYEFIVGANGYSPQRKKVSVMSERASIDFSLTKGNQLIIQVTDTAGTPIEGVIALFADEDPSLSCFLNKLYNYDSDRGSREFRHASTSDENGQITLEHIASEIYTINLSKFGYIDKKLPVQITGQDKTANVVLQKE